MRIEDIRQKAEDVAKKYNPEGLTPFPFGKIQEEEKDLRILLTDKLPTDVSGAIGFFTEGEKSEYAILINKNKPATRQQFTIAHEFGHYFLHKHEIKEEFFIDGENVLDRAGMLYHRDRATADRLEIEANNFAASLIMPSDLVKKAWEKLNDVDDCALLFNVSVEAMSIRLTRLGLVN